MQCAAYTVGSGNVTVASVKVTVCRPNLRGMGEASDLYCFECRKRQRHWLFLTDDEWYDPTPVWKCDRCWGDHTRFPR